MPYMVFNIVIYAVCLCVPDGAGICDPCEKELTDSIGHLDLQQREDITQSAQVSCLSLSLPVCHSVSRGGY